MKKILSHPLTHGTALLAGALVTGALIARADPKTTPATAAPRGISRLSSSPRASSSVAGDFPTHRLNDPLPVRASNKSGPSAQVGTSPRFPQPKPGTPPPEPGSNPPPLAVLAANTRASTPRQATAVTPPGPAMIDPPHIPAALAMAHLDVSQCSPAEQTAIRAAEEHFAEVIAEAPNQDPASLAYADDWNHAFNLHQEQLRITLGWDRYNRLSALVSQNAQATP